MNATPKVDHTTIPFRHPCRDGSTTRCEACLRMDDLEFEGYIIPGLVSTPRSVMAELMRATRAAQNEHHDPILLRLPPELASRIFELCIPEFIGRADVRFALTSVCQGWRRIALSAPGIWAQRYVNLTGYWRPGPQMLKEWLERSRGVPLRMAVDAHNPAFSTGVDTVSSQDDDKAKALIEVLNSFSDRWNDVYFSCVPEAFMELLKGNDKGTPALSSLSLMQVSLPSIQFSLEHVRSARAVSVRNAAMLFDMAPNMEDCDIPLCSPRYPSFEGQDVLLQPLANRIVHRHLRKLTISLVEWMWQTENLLRRLTAPALRSLTIPGSTWEEAVDIPFPAVHSLLVDSACVLKELCITGSRYKSAELIHLLAQEALASLVRLEVRANGWSEGERPLSNELFERLVETAAEGGGGGARRPFLPWLQSLTFEPDEAYSLEVFPDRRFPWDQFLKLFACHQRDLQARWQHMRPLREVKLKLWCPEDKKLDEIIFVDGETVRSLVELKWRQKSGVELVVESCGVWGAKDRDLLKDYEPTVDSR
ncbi:hypothetical protein CVT26_006703 [Gymnopilus dilepis]|uniref:Uncharacterized protein n=1 Tax=Gymnopilus dilepis TaxID=231916 RepID=A0A409Y2V1_9AGAR|nr:hypothetical protein CVT26_006703 [Gymnopilus dilepis]